MRKTNKTKILALDFGKSRIGLAIAEGEVIASLEVVRSFDFEEAAREIATICRREMPEKIVLGLPVGNQESEDRVRSFAMNLHQITELPVDFTDETLTSKEAERILKDLKLDPKSEKYKQELDRISAKLILEQYLKEAKN